MIEMTDQEETDFVNGFLDRSIPEYRQILRSVADQSISIEAGVEAIGRILIRGLVALDTDTSNFVGDSLAYEISLSVRNEIGGGRPYRLDRPYSTMMRTSLRENAQKFNENCEPLMHMVWMSFFYLRGKTENSTTLASSKEARGADLLSEYIETLDIFDPNVLE